MNRHSVPRRRHAQPKRVLDGGRLRIVSDLSGGGRMTRKDASACPMLASWKSDSRTAESVLAQQNPDAMQVSMNNVRCGEIIQDGGDVALAEREQAAGSRRRGHCSHGTARSQCSLLPIRACLWYYQMSMSNGWFVDELRPKSVATVQRCGKG